jgi:hypothetical protein
VIRAWLKHLELFDNSVDKSRTACSEEVSAFVGRRFVDNLPQIGAAPTLQAGTNPAFRVMASAASFTFETDEEGGEMTGGLQNEAPRGRLNPYEADKTLGLVELARQAGRLLVRDRVSSDLIAEELPFAGRPQRETGCSRFVRLWSDNYALIP